MIRNTDQETTLADLYVAVLLHRPVTIDYENAAGERSVRKVEPFEIVPDAKHPFFRAMDRLSGDYRSFRFDRLAAYRVSNAAGRYRIPRPVSRFDSEDRAALEEIERQAETTSPEIVPPADLDTEWGAWLESQYDPDAPVPYLPTPYAVNEEK